MATNDRFEEKLAESREYEIALSRWLQQARNFYVLPTYDYSGLAENKAPRMSGSKHGLIVPDLLAAKDGRFVWFEVKLKTSAALYRKTNTWQTGIPLRHYHHYTELQLLTGALIWLVFIHREEQEVRFGELSVLRVSQVDRRDVMSKGGMVFFAWHELSRLMSFSELDKYRETEKDAS